MKNPFKKRNILAAVTMAALTFGAWANPSGPDVRNGQVNITGLGSQSVNIEQLTNRAIVNWDSFSIGPQEAVNFLQPSQIAVILNRVTGQDPSQILGSLRANGQVFLINPNGILFGPGSTVDVGGLVASTLGLSDADFLAGNYNFQQDANFDLASVVNQGTITVSEGGFAILTAPLVSNEGVIVANLGKVLLAGGESTTLNFDGRDLINYNVGQLSGEAGTVVLPREAVSGLLADLVGVDDRATGFVERPDGSLALDGGSGRVYQAGEIRADGKAGHDAGEVVLDSARLTVLGANSVTAADGQGLDSDGGSVYALSDLGRGGPGGLTSGLVGSTLSARGGETGDGGFIEFSGERFALGSLIDASADGGVAGAFLLDPQDIIIVSGGNVPGQLVDPGPGVNQTINDGTLETLSTTVSLITLQADRDIRFEMTGAGLLDLTPLSTGPLNPNVEAQGHFVLNAGRDVLLGNDIIRTPAIDILAGRNVSDTGVGTGGRIEAFDIDIGVNATNPLTTGTTVAGRTAQLVGGFVDINFARLGAEPTVSANPVVANPQRQDLTVLAVGNVNLTDVTTVPVRGSVNTADQVSAERYNAEANNVNSGTNNRPGIMSSTGNVTLDFNDPGNPTNGGRFFTAGKGVNTANGSGDRGRNSVVTLGLGSSITLTAGALVDRASGAEFSDIATNRGNVTLLATNGDIGALDGGSVNSTQAGAPFDIAGEAITATTLRVGSLLAIDADNETVTANGTFTTFTNTDVPGGGINFLNIQVNDGQAYVRNRRFSNTMGPAVVFDPTISAIRTDGTFNVTDARFANQGNIGLGRATDATEIVRLAAGSSLVIEAIAEGGDAGTISDLNGNNNNVLLAADAAIALVGTGTVGTLGNSIEIDGVTTGGDEGILSARSTNGGVFVDAADDIEIGDLELVNTVLNTTVRVETGVMAGTDVKINAVAGDLFINNDVTAADDVELVAGDDIFIQNDLLNADDTTNDGVATITAGDNAILHAIGGGGNITQVQGAGALAGFINAPDVGLFAGQDIGTSGNFVDIDANNLAIDAGPNAADDAFVQDVDEVTIINFVPGQMAANNVTGNDAGGDYRVQAAGNIVVNDAVTGGDVSLIGTAGNITLNANVGDAGTANTVLSTPGNITQTAGTVRATNVGLDGNNIGVAGNSLDTRADNITIDAEGNAYIQDFDAVTIINQVISTAVNDTVTGNDSNGNDYRVQAAGTITVNDGVTGGDISLISTAGNVAINQLVAATADAVVEASGNITDSGAGAVNGTNVGLEANNVGTLGNHINIDAGNLSIDAANDAFVTDSNAVILVDSVTSTAFNDIVTGNDAGDDLRVTAAGNITVNAGTNGVTGNDIDIVSGGNVIQTAGNVGDGGTSDVVVKAANNITQVNGQLIIGTNVGVEATGGSIGVPNAALDANAVDITATNVALQAGASANVRDTAGGVNLIAAVTAVQETVTTVGTGTSLELEANNGLDADLNINTPLTIGTSADLVADDDVIIAQNVTATNNIVIVAENDGGSDGLINQTGGTITADGLGLMAAGAITVPNLAVNFSAFDSTLAVGDVTLMDNMGDFTLNGVTAVDESVNTVRAGGNLKIQATDGNLFLNVNAVAGRDIELDADGNIAVNGNITAAAPGATVVLKADFDDNNTGNITQVNGNVITAANVGLSAATGIGTAANPVDIVATNLSMETSGGSAYVVDTAGGLTIVDTIVGLCTTVTGNNAGVDYHAQTVGQLIVNDQITATDISLVSTTGGIRVNQNVTATTDAVLSGALNINGPGVVQATNVGLDGLNIGSSGDSFDVITDNLAIDAEGNAYVEDPDTVTIINAVTATAIGTAVTGNDAVGDYRLQTAGTITVDDAVSGGEVTLINTAGNIVVNQNVGDAGTVNNVLSTQGDISGAGTVRGTNVGLDGVNVGTAANQINTQADNIAIDAENSAYVNEADAVTVIDLVRSTAALDPVNGNDALVDYRLQAGGAITVDDVITGGDVSLIATAGGITVNQNVGDAGTVDTVLSAPGDITGNGVVRGTNVGLDGNNIGTVANNLNTQANNLTIDSEGSAFVRDADAVTIVNQVVSTALADTVTGNDAVNDYRVQAGGTITVTDAVTGGDISLVATVGNIAVNQVVTATTDVVLQAAGSITDAGAGRVNGANVGLAANNIGTAGNHLTIDADNLAVDAGNDAFVADVDDVTLVDSVVSTAANDTVTGNDATNDFRVTAVNNLTVNAGTNGVTGDDIDLVSTAGNVIQTDGTIAATDAVVIKANQNLTQVNGEIITGTNVGLEATNGSIGTPNAGVDANAVDINTTNLAVQAGGSANVRDTAGGMTLINQVTAVQEMVTGTATGTSLELEANGAGANLTINDAITIGTSADLVADDTVTITQNLTATNNIVIRADNDGNNVGNIAQTGGLITADGLGLAAAGTIDDGAGGALNTAVNTTAIDGPAAPNVNIANVGDLVLNGITAVDEAVGVIRSSGNIIVKVTAGSLTLNVDAIAGGDIDLIADTNVILNGNVTAATAGADVVVVADFNNNGAGAITQQNGRLITGENVGLSAGNGIGTAANPVDVVATNFSMETATGGAYVVDTTGGVNVINSIVGLCTTVTGNNAGGDYFLQSGGQINVNDEITGGDVALVSTGSGIAVNRLITATQDAVLSANGDITDSATGAVNAVNVGLDGNNIGTVANNFNIDADNLAIDSEGSAFVIDSDGVNITANVVTAGTAPSSASVTGNDAVTDYRVQAAGDITVNDGVTGTDITLLTTAGNITVNQVVAATTDVVLSATGNITDAGAGQVNGTNVGLAANNIGTGANHLTIDANNLAVDAGNDAFVADVDDVTLVDSVVSTAANDTVTGNDAANDFRVTAVNDLTVNAGTNGVTGDDIDLVSTTGNVVHTDGTIAATDAVVIKAAQNVTQVNGEIITGVNVGLEATGGSIGVPNAALDSNAVDINATNVAIQAPAGSANVRDTAGGVTLVNLVTAVQETVTGTNTGTSLELEANGAGANLTINDAIVIGTSADLVADDTVTITQNLTATNNIVVRADNDGNNVGNIAQTGGLITADGLGLAAAGTIDDGAGGALNTAVNTSAIDGPAAPNVNIANTGDLTLNGITAVDEAVGVIRSNGNIIVKVTAGSLTLNVDAIAGGDIDLIADTNIILNGNVTAATAGADVVIAADFNNNGAGAITQQAGRLITGENVGLSAGNGIGTAANPVDVVATNFSMETATGGAYVIDTTGGVNIVDSIVGLCTTVTGNTAGGDYFLQSGGQINVNDEINGGDVALVSTGSGIAVNRLITATQDAVLSANGDITDSATGAVNAVNVGLDGNNIGTAANNFNIDGDNLAIDSEASAFVVDSDEVTITANVVTAGTAPSSASVTGNDATADYRVQAGGNIIVDDLVTGGDISLVTAAGDITVNQNVGDAGTVDNVLSASGNITGNGIVRGTNVGLDGNNIGAAANSFDTQADNLAIDSEGSAYVQDADGVTLVNQVVSTAANDTVTGNDAAADYRVQAGGALVVDDVVTGGDITLATTAGGITVNQNVGDAGTVDNVLSTPGDITGNGVVQGTNVGLDGNNIGAAGNSFDTQATNITIDSEGNAYVQDADAVNIVNQVVSTAANDTVTGNDAVGDYRVQAGGNISVDDGVTGADVSLITTAGNITVNQVVAATTDAVLQATGNITDAGAGQVNGTNVGLAANNIGTGANHLTIDANNLAVDAGNDAFVADVDDVTLVDSVVSTAVNDTVTGNDATNDFRVTAVNNLTVNAGTNGVTGDDIDLVSTAGDVNLTDGAVAATDAVVVKANGTITQVDGETLSGVNVGLEATTGSIGVPNAAVDSNAIDITATNVAIQAPAGSANVRDTAGGVTLVNAVTAVQETVTGTNTGTSLELEANGAGANLTINDAIVIGTSADLVADDTVTITQNLTATNNIVVRADNDGNNVGNIAQTGGLITADGLGLAAAGTIDNGAGGALNTAVNNTAIDGPAAPNVNIANTGDLTLNGITAVDEAVGVIRSSGNIIVKVTAGSLTLNVDAIAGGDIDLIADTNIILNGNVTAATAGADVVIAADFNNNGAGAITQQAGRLITGENVGLSAGNGIGTAANPVDVVATNFSMETATGGAYVIDTTGGVNIVDSIVGLCTTVTGNTAGGDYFLQSGGQINVNDEINGGDVALVSTGSGIAVNRLVTATQDAVLSANGDITDSATGAVNAVNVGLDGNNIGTVANNFNIDGDNLAIDSEASAFVVDSDEVTITANVVTAGTAPSSASVTGNDATTDYRVQAGGDITVDDGVTGGDITLLTTAGNITVNQVVAATTDVVLSATGNITDAGAGQVNGTNVGLAANNIGTGANHLTIDANNLAVDAGNDAFVADVDDVTLVDSVVSTAANDTVTGNDATNDFRVTAVNDLTVNAGTNGVTGDDIDLVSTGGNVVHTDGTIAATDAVVVKANNNITQVNGETITGVNVGLEATTGNIGVPNANLDANAVDINATNVAIQAPAGSANVRDTAGGVTLVNLVTAVQETVTGTATGTSLELEANGAGANLTINDAITIGTSADLVADDTVTITQNLTATNNIVVRADNDGNNVGNIAQTGGLITADGLGLAAAGTIDDGAGGALNTAVTNTAIDGAAAPNVNINNVGDLTLNGITAVDESVGVIRSSGNIVVKVTAGSLTLNVAAIAGGDIDLIADANIALNGNVTAASAGADVIVVADFDNDGNGAITQTNGRLITGENVGLSAGQNIGTAANPIDVAAINFAMETAGGSAYVVDVTGGVNIIDNIVGLCTTVTGNNAGGDYFVQSGGQINVNDEITGGDVALISTGSGIAVNRLITATQDAVLSADGDITDSATGAVNAVNVGLDGNNIGTVANNFNIDADNLAIDSEGSALVIDSDAVTITANVVTAGTAPSSASVTGNEATTDYRVQAGGDITVDDGVTGTDITLLTTAGNITVNQVVAATTDVVLSATGNITDAGAGQVNGTNVGLAANNIGTGANHLTIDANNLAVDAGNDAFVADVDDVTLVDSVVSTAANDTVTGNDATNDFRVTAVNDLTVNAGTNGVTGDDIDLVSTGGNVVHTDGTIAATDAVVVKAANNITQVQGETITGVNVGLEATAGNIGTPNAALDANAVDINTTNLAVQAGQSANVIDTAGGMNIIGAVTAVQETVTTVGTGTSLELEANGAGANLAINTPLTIGTSADLVADDTVTITQNLTATNNIVIRADNDGNNVGNIAQTGGLITADGLGLAAAGTIDNGAGGALNTAVNSTAIDGPSAPNVNINNVGDLALNGITAVDEAVAVIRSSGNIIVKVTGGSLTLNVDAIAGGDIDLIADTNVILNGNVTAATAGADVVIAADFNNNGAGAITQTNGRLITGENVGLSAGNGIGTAANPVDVAATNFSMETATGGAYVIDTTGGVNIVDSIVGLCTTVTGNTAGGDYFVQSGGQINVNDEINGGDVVLVSTGSGIAVNRLVTATQDAVLSANGDITDSATGAVNAVNVGLDGNNIGTVANNFNIDADNLAIDSEGSAFVIDSDAVTITANVVTAGTAPSSASVTGNEATTDYRVQAGGDITVDDGVTGTDITLLTTAGNITVNQVVAATTDVVLSATGNITDAGAGQVNGTNVGLAANNIGTGANHLTIDANNLAVDAGNDAFVADVDDVTLVDSVVSTAANDTVTGNDATNDFRVTAVNDLTVNAGTNGVTGDDIDLVSTTGNVNLTDGTVAATDAVVVKANNNITQGNGETVTGANVGLEATTGSIGTPNAGADANAVDINATNVAIQAPAGSANVRDTAGGVTLVNLVTAVQETVTGTNTGTSLELEANGGAAADLTIDDAINVGTSADLVADDDVIVNQNVTATNNLVIRADNELDEDGNITGAGVLTADSLGLAAAGDINGGGAAPLVVNVNNFAVDTDVDNNGMGGDVFVRDNAGNFTIAAVTGVDETVGVARAGGDLKLDAAGGDLVVNVDAIAGDDIDLLSITNVTLNADVTAASAGSVVAIVADFDNNASGTLTQTNGEFITGTTIGLSAGQGIGTAANAIDINATNLSMETGLGSAYVVDTAGGVTIIDVVNGLCSTITGNNAADDYRVQANGDITVNDGITATDIALVTTGGGIAVNQTIAATTDVVLSATGDLTSGAAGNVTGVNVGLDGNNIGTVANEFTIDADNLAVDAEGNSYVEDADEVTLIDSVVATALNDTVTGNDAVGDYRVEAGGNITVDDAVNGADVALVTGAGNIAVNQAITATTDAVLSASGDITDSPTGSITAANIGLDGANIGTVANPINIDANNLSLDATNNAFVLDPDEVTLVNTVTATAANDTVTGNQAGNDYRVQAGGNITVDDAVNGTDVSLITTGGIAVNQAVTATSDAVLSAQQDITGNGLITSPNLGLDGNNVGTAANPLNIDANNLAMDATTNGYVSDVDEVTLVDNVTATAANDSVTGNQAGNDYRVQAGGNITVDDAVNGTDVSLVTTGGITVNQAVTATDDAVLSAQQDITGNGLITAPDLGLDGNNIGTAANPLNIDANNLALDATNDGFVSDPDEVTLVNSVVATAVNDTVTGNQAGNDYRVQAGGNITVDDAVNGTDVSLITTAAIAVNQAITATDDAVLSATGDITGNGLITAPDLGLDGNNIGTAANPLNIDANNLAMDATNDGFVSDPDEVTLVNSVVATAVNDTVTGNQAGNDYRVQAGGNITVDDAVNGTDVSLVTTGGITVNQAVTATDDAVLSAQQDITGNGLITAPDLGLDGNNVGTAANPLNIDANNLALDATNDGFVSDPDEVTLVNSVVATAVNDTVTGNQAGNDYRVQAGGNITVDDAVNGTDVSLISAGNIAVNQAVTATDDAVLSATGDIAGNGVITAPDLGLDGRNIGSAANPINIDADNLALDADNDAFVTDSDDVTLVDGVTSTAVNDAVNGNQAGNDLRVVATGNLTINSPTRGVRATDIDLVSNTGDVVLNNGMVVATDDAVIKAGRDITGPAMVNAVSLGLEAGRDIGGLNNPIMIDATEGTFRAGNDSFVRDKAGGINIVARVDAVQESVVGNNVGRDGQVTAVNGMLMVNSPVNIGRNGELLTEGTGDIVIKAPVDVPNGNTVIISAGDILNPNGTGQINTQGLGIAAPNGTIGTAARPIDVEVQRLSIGTVPAFINDPTGFTRVPRVTAITNSVVNVVFDPVATNPNPLFDGVVLAQDNVRLVEQFLEELAEEKDSEDKIYNEEHWHPLDDEDFGLRKRR